MPKPEVKKPVTLHQVIAALLDDSVTFPPTYLHQFSDLEGVNLEALRSVWPQVNPNRRAALMEDLENLNNTDTLVLFDHVAVMALEDPDPRVRRAAVRLLWDTEEARLAPVFIKMLQEDPDTSVRAAVATALGRFIYMGEVEEIPENVLHQVEKVLLKTMQSEDEELVRQRALESLGFSGRKEVAGLLRKAYESGDNDWLVSALFAMGRSADNTWAPSVMKMIDHQDAPVQIAAINAAGELAVKPAMRPLLNMLDDELIDPEVRLAIIWALSNIGGEEVEERLDMMLEETEDEDEEAFIQEAMDNLSFTNDVSPFEMFDFENQKMIDEKPDPETKLPGSPDGENRSPDNEQSDDPKRHQEQ